LKHRTEFSDNEDLTETLFKEKNVPIVNIGVKCSTIDSLQNRTNVCKMQEVPVSYKYGKYMVMELYNDLEKDSPEILMRKSDVLIC